MAMFSKRHYEVVARLIAQAFKDFDNDALHSNSALVAMKKRCMDIFTADNPRFDAERFNKACEPRSEGKR